jgi:hypothetical protein
MHVILSILANKNVTGCKTFYRKDKEVILYICHHAQKEKKKDLEIVPQPVLCLKCILQNIYIYIYIYIIPQQKTKTGTSANHRASQVSVCLDSQIARAKIN